MRWLFLLVLTSSTGCVSSTPDEAAATDLAAIRALAARFGDAFESGDPDAVARCMTEDFVALVPAEPALAGRDRVREQVASDLAAMDVRELVFELDEVHVAGDWAWARASSRAEVVADGQVARIRGKTLWIFRRGVDGAWRIARDASSGDER